MPICQKHKIDKSDILQPPYFTAIIELCEAQRTKGTQSESGEQRNSQKKKQTKN